MILTSDWHLTDNPADEYRWRVFDELAKAAQKYDDREVYMLGDLTDRKDRHSAELVNRVVASFMKLLVNNVHITVLMGNHDKPISGTPFWQFLKTTYVQGALDFVTAPLAAGDLLLLPYSADPRVDWQGIPFARYKAIFMHQTVTGAVGNNGVVLENKNMPLFPRGPKLYSGDIHTPQVINRVSYVGAPHHVAFGDNYTCRMLRLDDSYSIAQEITLKPPSKWMIRVSSKAELTAHPIVRLDQARVIYKLPLSDIEHWPEIHDWIANWGELRSVILVSIEPDIEGTSALSEEELPTFDVEPESVLRMFAEAEEIDETLLSAGLEFVRELSHA